MTKIYTLLLSLFGGISVFSQNVTDTLPSKTTLQEVVVSGIRAKEKMPITQINITQKQIEEKYYGADIPSLLNFTPSINTYSDNGTGIGYSYFRLRGLDQTRVNFTINGIPVNDPEGQGTFFNNFADLASSAGGIQVQRGVGTSTNGSASIAGSINLTTKPLSEKPEFTLNTGFGSYNSRRMTAEYQTGMIANKFAFYGRVSDVSTDGYRANSGSHIRSMFLSGAYFGKKSFLKFNVMNGSAESSLAYLGIDKTTLATDRTANPFVNKERDAFIQNFYQLQYSYQFNKYSGISFSGYYVYGNAPRFQYYYPGAPFDFLNMPPVKVDTTTFTSTDAVLSYRLNQNFYGAYANYYYKKDRFDLNVGLHANSFSSDHFMEINWARLLPPDVKPDHQSYFNTGYKTEISAYAKLTYSLTDRIGLFADMQMRNATFKYRAKDMTYHHDTYSVDDMSWTFFNPKLGLTYQLNNYTGFYFMYGRTSREPTRNDYFQDEFATRDIKQNELKPETVNDFELGTNIRIEKLALQANLYWMDFQNQIVNTGELNLVGYPITKNVGSSFRRGVEVNLTWKPISWLWLMNSSGFSQNQIKDITLYYTDPSYTSVPYNYKNSSPALSPNIIVNQSIRFIPLNYTYIEFTGHYVSSQYLDNTSNKDLSISDFYFVDARLGLSLKKWIHAGEPAITLQMNNITDQKYTPSGATTANSVTYDISGNPTKSSTALFYPAATRNFFVTLTWKF